MFVEVKSGMLLNLDRIDYIEPPKNGNGSIIHFGARSVDIPAPIEELIDIIPPADTSRDRYGKACHVYR